MRTPQAARWVPRDPVSLASLTMTYFGSGRAAPLTWPKAKFAFASAGLHAAHERRLHAVAPRERRSSCATRATKKPGLFRGRAFLLHRVLTMTYFHAVYPALSSARLRFTVLFGMGRRGPTALCSSGIQLSGVTRTRVSDPDVFWKKYFGFNDCNQGRR